VKYYLEYGGGLGDIFYQMFSEGSYSVLQDMKVEDRATVVLITHNPHVRELFDYHPKADQIEVKDLGYWLPEQDSVMRKKCGLPEPKPPLPVRNHRIEFYPAPSDEPVLRGLCGQRYVIFSASAGLPGRSIPPNLVEPLLRQAVACSLLPVFVGRSYERLARMEYRSRSSEALDLVDQLTVPGVGRLVQDAAGVVCCHSAINILAWLLRKPQLLLYPKEVYQQHLLHHDMWAFGADFPECLHARFEDLRIAQLAEELFHRIAPRRSFAPAAGVYSRRKETPMKTTRLPLECERIAIDESIGRLTPVQEVKYLCWRAQQVRGNIVEIGCNKGLTTRDLARTNPDKIIYAVDYFADDVDLPIEQHGEKPSPSDFCVYARHIRNVVCIHAKSAGLNYEALKDVRFVFVDGNHNLAGVKADTEPALEYLQKHRGGVLAWHDYYEGAPGWVGVKQYVDSLDLPLERVEGTWLALAEVKARRVAR
jgi:hypothetical protein